MTKNIIPTINISPIVKNGFDNSKSIIAINKIRKACINIGFFQITGHGINQKDNWVSLLQEEFYKEGTSLKLINSSVSGDTTSGGLERLKEDLKISNPDYVLIELGGNDALRGYPVKKIKDNLKQMISLVKANNSKPLLMQIRIPPNYGQKYTYAFEKIYVDLALAENINLLPFMLENIGVNSDLMQSDGIHPNKKAQEMIAKNVKKNLNKVLFFK